MENRGLYIRSNFVSEGAAERLVEEIDQNTWSDALSRRTQHYGYLYDYSSRRLRKAACDMPTLITAMARACERVKQLPMNYFNSCIVNEYTRNQGISAHVDSKLFSEHIVTVSLLSACNFIIDDGVTETRYYLQPRTMIIMSDEVRYEYKHSIPSTVTMIDDNGNRIRKSNDYRRISVTFRNAIV